jgi:hypothetical protein
MHQYTKVFKFAKLTVLKVSFDFFSFFFFKESQMQENTAQQGLVCFLGFLVLFWFVFFRDSVLLAWDSLSSCSASWVLGLQGRATMPCWRG